jgi:hypothetical protein
MAYHTSKQTSQKSRNGLHLKSEDGPSPFALIIPQELLDVEHGLGKYYLSNKHESVFECAALCGDAEIVKAAFMDLASRRRAVRAWTARRVKDLMRLKPSFAKWLDGLDGLTKKRCRTGRVKLADMDMDFFNFDHKTRINRERKEYEESQVLTRTLHSFVKDADHDSEARLYPTCCIVRADGVMEMWHNAKKAMDSARASGVRFIVFPIDVMNIAIGRSPSIN